MPTIMKLSLRTSLLVAALLLKDCTPAVALPIKDSANVATVTVTRDATEHELKRTKELDATTTPGPNPFSDWNGKGPNQFSDWDSKATIEFSMPPMPHPTWQPGLGDTGKELESD